MACSPSVCVLCAHPETSHSFFVSFERTGDISSVERAHTRLENAVRRVPDRVLPDREKKLLMDDVKRLGEIG